jgi:hypothetical protein
MPNARSFAPLVPILAIGAVACAATPTPRIAATTQSANQATGAALGPSYVLIPLPSDDDSILGRVLDDTPQPGHSLDETSRANPCDDKLSPPKASDADASFQDAQDLSQSASARAAVGIFGFHGDLSTATHFLYTLTTTRRESRIDTADYAACCKEKGCGIGYVSALIYGNGQYATGQQTSASGGANVSIFGSGDGQVAMNVLEKRDVKGWLAALVTITDPAHAKALGPLGIAQAAGITESTVPQQVKDIYVHNTMQIDGQGEKYTFKLASGETLTENEFVGKYHDVTGSTELDDINTRRNWGTVALWGGLAALSTGVIVLGVTKLTRPCVDTDAPFASESGCQGSTPSMWGGTYDPNKTTSSSVGIPIIIVGAAGLIGTGIPLMFALGRPNGSPTSHYLTDADARIYANRYNHALLQKTVRDVQSSTGSITVTPTIGMGTLGVAGTF